MSFCFWIFLTSFPTSFFYLWPFLFQFYFYSLSVLSIYLFVLFWSLSLFFLSRNIIYCSLFFYLSLTNTNSIDNSILISFFINWIHTFLSFTTFLIIFFFYLQAQCTLPILVKESSKNIAKLCNMVVITQVRLYSQRIWYWCS